MKPFIPLPLFKVVSKPLIAADFVTLLFWGGWGGLANRRAEFLAFITSRVKLDVPRNCAAVHILVKDDGTPGFLVSREILTNAFHDFILLRFSLHFAYYGIH